jgi:hypothetical protein
MAALARDFVRVVVRLGSGVMGCGGMAGFTGYFRNEVVFHQAFPINGSWYCIYASGNIMPFGRVTSGTVEILPVDSHVNV